MGTLKENIQHDIHILEPKSLHNVFILDRKIESKNMGMTTNNTTSNTYRENNVPSSNPPQRLTPKLLDEIRKNVSPLIGTTIIVRDKSVERRNYST